MISIYRGDFFNSVYHRFLLSAKSEMRCLCLKAMAITYGRHHITIGPFMDSKYIVNMLSRCSNPIERDHLVRKFLEFLSTLSSWYLINLLFWSEVNLLSWKIYDFVNLEVYPIKSNKMRYPILYFLFFCDTRVLRDSSTAILMTEVEITENKRTCIPKLWKLVK